MSLKFRFNSSCIAWGLHQYDQLGEKWLVIILKLTNKKRVERP
jgi:hypothetical protein